jgi:DNA-binding CsgD family transcriptional regulator
MFWSLLFDLLLCVIGAVVFMVTKRTLFIYSLFYIPTCVFAFLFTAMVGIIFFRRQYYLDKSKLLVFIGFALSFPAVAVLMILVYTPGLYRQYAANIGFLPMLLCFEISLMSAFSLSLKKTESLKRDLYVKTGDKDRLFLERCAYFGLSDREAQITKLLIGGNDAKKIAQILGISYHTVRNIRRKIYEKTGADSIGVLINRF